MSMMYVMCFITILFLIVILSGDTVSDRTIHFNVLQLVCDDEQDKKKN